MTERERAAWVAEIKRLREILAAFEAIGPKRRRTARSGEYEFAPEVNDLRRQRSSLIR